MRPVKLIMNSFGPFVSTHEIDFSLIEDGSIFLITGDTGSGKTTIFDAIVFALFGKASGNFRKPDDFKSQYADEGDVCFVKLSFLLRDKEYTVYREPQHTITTRNGTQRVIPTNATLTLPNGDIITGVKEVDGTLEELIGLNVQQFKRTVMLAQGEFRAMLESDGREKQEIFRRIFDTYLYERITQNLKLAYDECKEEIKVLSVKLQEQFIRLKPFSNDELKTFISSQAPDIKKICESILILKQENQQKLISLNKQNTDTLSEIQKIDIAFLKKQNENILRLVRCREEIASLKERAPQIALKREQVTLLYAAAKMAVDEGYSRSYKTAFENAEKETLEIKSRICSLEETLKNADDSEYVNSQIQEKNKLLQQISVALTLFDEIHTAEKEVAKCEETLKVLEEKRLTADNVLAYCTLSDNISKISDKLNKCCQYKDELLSLMNVTKEFETQKQRYLTTLSMLLDNHAGILAKDLPDGSPCPVCGSTNHPNKAVLSEAVSEAQVENEKLLQERLAQALQTQREKVTLIKAALEQENSENIDELINQLESQYSELKKQRDIMQDTVPFEYRTISVDTAKENLNSITSLIDKTLNNKNLHLNHIEKTRQKLDSNFKDEPYTLELQSKTKADIVALQTKLDEMSNAKNNLNVLQEKLTSKTNEVIFNRENYLKIRQKVKDAIKENGFESYEHYRSFVRDESEIKTLEEYILNYDKQNASLLSEEKLLNDSVGDKSPVDLAQLEQKLSQLTEKAKILSDEIYKAKSADDTFTQTFSALEAIHKQTIDKQRNFENLSKLYNAAKGENAQRVDFERYVLSTYFDDILVSANKRFSQMTSQRYQMHRKREKGKGRSAQGLDIEILDSLTGQNRAVSSLSGGESFKASLALALGLGDVVQSYSGGITIDTMFIDEGFGTLDQNSLSAAIQCLSELNRSTSRTIGIISHVSELKERIPTQIRVKTTTRGSKIEVIA